MPWRCPSPRLCCRSPAMTGRPRMQIAALCCSYPHTATPVSAREDWVLQLCTPGDKLRSVNVHCQHEVKGKEDWKGRWL